MATFVTRLQPRRLPDRAARQLPDQSTTLWVESSSTSDSRLRGALPLVDIGVCTPNDTATIMLACNGEPAGDHDDSSQRATLARTALCDLEGHARHAALSLIHISEPTRLG